MSFRYYITDTFDGNVKGTNDDAVAAHYAQTPEYFVVDSERSVWLAEDGEAYAIEEIESVQA